MVVWEREKIEKIERDEKRKKARREGKTPNLIFEKKKKKKKNIFLTFILIHEKDSVFRERVWYQNSLF